MPQVMIIHHEFIGTKRDLILLSRYKKEDKERKIRKIKVFLLFVK